MEHQAYVQADGDVGSISAKCEIESRTAHKRSQEPTLVPRTAFPYGRGDAPRRRITNERTSCREDRRAQRKALPASQYLGGGELSNERYPSLRSGTWRRALPPQHVHLFEAHGFTAEHGYL